MLQNSNEPNDAPDGELEQIGARNAATLSLRGDHSNFYMENKHAALAAHMLKSWIVIYTIDDDNPLYDEKCGGLS